MLSFDGSEFQSLFERPSLRFSSKRYRSTDSSVTRYGLFISGLMTNESSQLKCMATVGPLAGPGV